MGLFALEHSQRAYRADFAFYAGTVLALAAYLATFGPGGRRLEILAFALCGMMSWSAVEYALHRFVLHGLQPFKRWHAEHHLRPTALICSPTLLSASLILALVFLPALALGNLWCASALTLGVMSGYLAYAITHHATHHWRAESTWLNQRKRWHALHHHRPVHEPACYGVTTAVWDHIFGSLPRARQSTRSAGTALAAELLPVAGQCPRQPAPGYLVISQDQSNDVRP